MAPYAHEAPSLPTKLVSLAYPLMDVLVLGVLVRLLVANGAHAIGFALLVLGFAAVSSSPTRSTAGSCSTAATRRAAPLDIGWAVFYALLGASALHPSTRMLFERQAAQTFRLTGKRIGLLGTAALAAPALLLIRAVLATNRRRRGSSCRLSGAVRVGPDAHDRPHASPCTKPSNARPTARPSLPPPSRARRPRTHSYRRSRTSCGHRSLRSAAYLAMLLDETQTG